mmetsp:Transcript_7405/g.21910  ORF Transcript_7405/g.21910 Transcript_7405/m.21910 type:complete len:108 (+) Transcript_7405:297-620(+)
MAAAAETTFQVLVVDKTRDGMNDKSPAACYELDRTQETPTIREVVEGALETPELARDVPLEIAALAPFLQQDMSKEPQVAAWETVLDSDSVVYLRFLLLPGRAVPNR